MTHIVNGLVQKKHKRDTIVLERFKMLKDSIESRLDTLSGINRSKEKVVTAHRTGVGSEKEPQPFCFPRFANRNRNKRWKFENESMAFFFCSLCFFSSYNFGLSSRRDNHNHAAGGLHHTGGLLPENLMKAFRLHTALYCGICLQMQGMTLTLLAA